MGSTPFDDELGAHASIRAEGLLAPAVSSNQEHYSMRLPAGKWLVYPGYTTAFGPTVSAQPTPVTIAAKAATKTLLTLAYSTPTDGAVSGTTRLLDDPSESGGLYGVEACPSPASTTPGATCEITTMQIGPTGEYEQRLLRGPGGLQSSTGTTCLKAEAPSEGSRLPAPRTRLSSRRQPPTC